MHAVNRTDFYREKKNRYLLYMHYLKLAVPCNNFFVTITIIKCLLYRFTQIIVNIKT